MSMKTLSINRLIAFVLVIGLCAGNLARAVAQSYFESRERLGFPMLHTVNKVAA